MRTTLPSHGLPATATIPGESAFFPLPFSTAFTPRILEVFAFKDCGVKPRCEEPHDSLPSAVSHTRSEPFYFVTFPFSNARRIHHNRPCSLMSPSRKKALWLVASYRRERSLNATALPFKNSEWILIGSECDRFRAFEFAKWHTTVGANLSCDKQTAWFRRKCNDARRTLFRIHEVSDVFGFGFCCTVKAKLPHHLLS